MKDGEEEKGFSLVLEIEVDLIWVESEEENGVGGIGQGRINVEGGKNGRSHSGSDRT